MGFEKAEVCAPRCTFTGAYPALGSRNSKGLCPVYASASSFSTDRISRVEDSARHRHAPATKAIKNAAPKTNERIRLDDIRTRFVEPGAIICVCASPPPRLEVAKPVTLSSRI